MRPGGIRPPRGTSSCSPSIRLCGAVAALALVVAGCAPTTTNGSDGGGPPAPTPVPTAVACGTLQARIDATAAGGSLDLSGCSYAEGAIISRPLSLRGATIRVAPGQGGLLVTASDVTLDDLRVVGAQSAVYDEREVGILVQGTAAAPIGNVIIRRSDVGTFGGDGIRLDHVTGFTIADDTVHDVVYAGVIILSGDSGSISSTVVERVGLEGSDANDGNAYGIAITNFVGEGPSHDITVDGNTVTDVPTWHALDTHAGQRIAFTDNKVFRSSRGLFITSESGGPTRASDVIVTGNLFGSPDPVTFNLQAVTTYDTVNVTITGNTAVGWPAGRVFHDFGGLSTGLVVSDNTCDGRPC